MGVASLRMWACGAAGSALPWHGRGRRFDPGQVHQSNQAFSKTPLFPLCRILVANFKTFVQDGFGFFSSSLSGAATNPEILTAPCPSLGAALRVPADTTLCVPLLDSNSSRIELTVARTPSGSSCRSTSVVVAVRECRITAGSSCLRQRPECTKKVAQKVQGRPPFRGQGTGIGTAPLLLSVPIVRLGREILGNEAGGEILVSQVPKPGPMAPGSRQLSAPNGSDDALPPLGSRSAGAARKTVGRIHRPVGAGRSLPSNRPV